MPCRLSLDIQAHFPCFQMLMPDICFLPRLPEVLCLERVQQHVFGADTDTVQVGATACSGPGGWAASPFSSPATPQLTASDLLGKISWGWERTEKEFFFLQFVDDARRNLGRGASMPGFSPSRVSETQEAPWILCHLADGRRVVTAPLGAEDQGGGVKKKQKTCTNNWLFSCFVFFILDDTHHLRVPSFLESKAPQRIRMATSLIPLCGCIATLLFWKALPAMGTRRRSPRTNYIPLPPTLTSVAAADSISDGLCMLAQWQSGQQQMIALVFASLPLSPLQQNLWQMKEGGRKSVQRSPERQQVEFKAKERWK